MGEFVATVIAGAATRDATQVRVRTSVRIAKCRQIRPSEGLSPLRRNTDGEAVGTSRLLFSQVMEQYCADAVLSE